MLHETKIAEFSSKKLAFIHPNLQFFGTLIRDSFFSFQPRILLFNSFTVISSGVYFLWGTPIGTPMWYFITVLHTLT